MSIPILNNLLENKGTPVGRQRFTWRELTPGPLSKLDEDAFSRVRIILTASVERDALWLKQILMRVDRGLRLPLAEVSRIEQHQASMLSALLGADHLPLESTIAHAQVAVEVTAAVAHGEPDAYQAQTYRFCLLENLDHLYRFAALLDRLEGRDANNILQGYTDIVAGRPAMDCHRAPQDDLRRPYERANAEMLTRINAVLVGAVESQGQQHLLHTAPTFADPLARQLYTEIASIRQQHAVQCATLADPDETVLEKWLIHEATEVYMYQSCLIHEPNPRVRALWERFLDYELGHLHMVAELIRHHEAREPEEILGRSLPPMVSFSNQRDFIRGVLSEELAVRSNGTEFVGLAQEGAASAAYRHFVNSDGSPSQAVAAGYRWMPGTELQRRA